MKFISIPAHIPNETVHIDIEKIVAFVYNPRIDHTLNISLSGGKQIGVSGELGRKLYDYLILFDVSDELERAQKMKG